MKTEAEIRGTVNLLEAYARQNKERLTQVPPSYMLELRHRMDADLLVVAYLKEILGDKA